MLYSASASDAVFSGLIVRCIIQLELIDSIQSVVFGPGSARKDEKHVLNFGAQSPVEHLSNSQWSDVVRRDRSGDEDHVSEEAFSIGIFL